MPEPTNQDPVQAALSELPQSLTHLAEFALDTSGKFTEAERIDFLLTLCDHKDPGTHKVLEVLSLRDDGQISEIASRKHAYFLQLAKRAEEQARANKIPDLSDAQLVEVRGYIDPNSDISPIDQIMAGVEEALRNSELGDSESNS